MSSSVRSAGADVQLLLDGSAVSDTLIASTVGGTPEIIQVNWARHPEFSFPSESWSSRSLFEPVAATSHTLTARVADDCGANGGVGGGHFKIESINVDVLAALRTPACARSGAEIGCEGPRGRSRMAVTTPALSESYYPADQSERVLDTTVGGILRDAALLRMRCPTSPR